MFQDKIMMRTKVVVALYPFRAIEGGDLSLEKVRDSFKIFLQRDKKKKAIYSRETRCINIARTTYKIFDVIKTMVRRFDVRLTDNHSRIAILITSEKICNRSNSSIETGIRIAWKRTTVDIRFWTGFRFCIFSCFCEDSNNYAFESYQIAFS